jgi:erythromycin esterase-like protein
MRIVLAGSRHPSRCGSLLEHWRWGLGGVALLGAALALLGWVDATSVVAVDPGGGLAQQTGLVPGVSAVSTLEFEAPSDDLGPLLEMIGEARVVGLGESAHRSGGILAAKARVMRFLVEEAGFRVVAFETEWTDAQLVDDYIKSDCEGAAVEVTRTGTRPVWHDATTVSLLEWLCAYNRAHPEDPVSFIGFNNIQPWHDVAALDRFLDARERGQLGEHAERQAIEGADAIRSGLARCEGADATSTADYGEPGSHPPPTPEDYAACIAALDAFDAALVERAEAAVEGTTDIRLHAASLRGFEDWYRWEVHPDGPLATPRGNESRDAAMAMILLDRLERLHPDQKAVLTAHSLHLNTASEAFRIAFPPQAAAVHVWESTQRMGNRLSEALGDDYRNVSFVAYQHSLETEPVTQLPDEVLAAQAPVAEVLLHELGEPYLLVDLHTTEPGALFDASLRYRLFYPLAPEAVGLGEAPLADTFDVLFFLDEAGPWTGLPAH